MSPGCSFALAASLLVAGCGKELNPDFCVANPEDARCRTSADASPDGPRPDASLMCPGSYTVTLPGIAGSRYRVEDTVDDWTSAAAACAADGAGTGANTHLLVLSSASERDALVDLADRERWVGHSDAIVEGVWAAVTDEVIDLPGLQSPVAPPWNDGEPNGGTSGNCAVIGQDLLLRDRSCTSEAQAYLCECDAYPDDPENY